MPRVATQNSAECANEVLNITSQAYAFTASLRVSNSTTIKAHHPEIHAPSNGNLLDACHQLLIVWREINVFTSHVNHFNLRIL